MTKETIADKLAKKAFYSEKIQESWMTHMKVFGPILQPAFIEDYQARIHLTSALNKISNRDVNGGFDILKKMGKSCVTDMDKAAWFFCIGLGYEMGGDRENMLACYQEAGHYGHDFYLPYLKIAKCAYEDAVYDVAKVNFLSAIKCLKMQKYDVQEQVILGTVYLNLASCLTMMHQFDEAQEALEISKKMILEKNERIAIEAILHAAAGKIESAELLLNEIEKQVPEMFMQIKKAVEKILRGENPQFSSVEIERYRITEFWNWFGDNQKLLEGKMERQEYDDIFTMIQPRLTAIFTFLEREVEFGIEPAGNIYQITLADFYMTALENGYRALLSACPEDIKKHWKFEIAH